MPTFPEYPRYTYNTRQVYETTFPVVLPAATPTLLWAGWLAMKPDHALRGCIRLFNVGINPITTVSIRTAEYDTPPVAYEETIVAVAIPVGESRTYPIPGNPATLVARYVQFEATSAAGSIGAVIVDLQEL